MIRASDLLGSEVRTEDGRSLGRVRDLRVRRARPGAGGAAGPWQLAGLVVGPRATLERLGIAGARRPEPITTGTCSPWDDVVSTDAAHGRVVVAAPPD